MGRTQPHQSKRFFWYVTLPPFIGMALGELFGTDGGVIVGGMISAFMLGWMDGWAQADRTHPAPELLRLATEAANAASDLVELGVEDLQLDDLDPQGHQNYIDARTRFDGATAEAAE